MFSTLLHHARPAVAAPSQCAVCHAWQAHRLCMACRDRHLRATPRCLQCGIDVPEGIQVCGACLTDPPAFDACVAAAEHGYPWNRLVTQFKFHEGLDLVAPLGALLLEAIERRQATHALPRPRWIVPVPLADQRLAERGYNQAWELARWLAARHPGSTARADLVLRLRDTAHQLQLTAAQRRANLRAAFMVEPAQAAALRGADVALVDDVMTTGATAQEVAHQLKRAGASHVQVWVVTRTPRS